MTERSPNSESAGGYDAGYSACPCFWGSEAGSLVKLLASQLDTIVGWSVLDAGCGEGKNAVYLAQRGARVHAIEISPLALRNTYTQWPNVQNVTWQEADVRQIDVPAAKFDIVIAYGLFHCFSSPVEVEEVVLKLQTATREGGYHVICAFNDRSQDLKAHPGFEPCLLSHSTYLSLYSSWEICFQTDSDLHEVHPNNNIPHTHSMTRLITRNPL